MNKYIKELIEANIFKDKNLLNRKDPRAKINIMKQEMDEQYKQIAMDIFNAYKQCTKRGRASIDQLIELMQNVKAKDTFYIPYATFDVALHFGNMALSTGIGSFTHFIKTICQIFKGQKISLNWLDVSGLTELDATFNGITDITVDISGWDVSNVKKLWKTFEKSNIEFDASYWDLSSCEELDGTFHGAQYISKTIETWKFSDKLKSMSECFKEIESDYFFPDLSKWDVSSVENLSYCFANTNISGILSDSVSELNIKNAVKLDNCFLRTKGYLDLSNWQLNKKKNVSLNYMFKESEIYDANIKGWNVKKVKSLDGMFDFSSYEEDLSIWGNMLSPLAKTSIVKMWTNGKSKIFKFNTFSQIHVQKL